MPVVVQVYTSSGKIVESARWEVELSNVQVGNMMAINIPFKDQPLYEYLQKYPSISHMTEKTSSGYNVSLSFQVQQIRHMIDTEGGPTSSTIASVHPQNRMIEKTLSYLMDQSKCDPKFIHSIRGDAKA